MRQRWNILPLRLPKLPQVPAELLAGRPSPILTVSHCPAHTRLCALATPGWAIVAPEESTLRYSLPPCPLGSGGKVHCPIALSSPSPHLPKKSTHCFSSPLPRYLKMKLGRREGGSKDARCATPARHWLRSPSFTIRFA